MPIELLPGSADPVPLKSIHLGALPGSHQGAIRVAKATEDLPQFDLLEFTGSGNVKRNMSGINADIAGINGRAVTAGQAAHYMVQGVTTAIKGNNYGPVTIPNQSLVGPDPDRPGGIRAVSNVKDSIGRALEPIATGAAGRLDLTGIRYDVAPQTPTGFEELVLGPGRRLNVQEDGLHLVPEVGLF
jgi:hypothetical protein